MRLNDKNDAGNINSKCKEGGAGLPQKRPQPPAVSLPLMEEEERGRLTGAFSRDRPMACNDLRFQSYCVVVVVLFFASLWSRARSGGGAGGGSGAADEPGGAPAAAVPDAGGGAAGPAGAAELVQRQAV
jgi:hypothetical protein